MFDEKYMKRAIELAQIAAAAGEVPVGAVVVSEKLGEIVGEGYNLREGAKNALAHAELIAVSNACNRLGGWRLPECSIYVTLEPCPMCCGAIINARIDNVYFGAYDAKSGSAVSVQKMFELPYNYRPVVTGGLLESECSQLISAFFRELRSSRKKSEKNLRFFEKRG